MEKIIKLEELDATLEEAYKELAEAGWENHHISLKNISNGLYLFTCKGKGDGIKDNAVGQMRL